jgi:hypothetical protein
MRLLIFGRWAYPRRMGHAVLEFGEDGELVTAPPCPIEVLNGSWLLEVQPGVPVAPQVRGPLRIEVGASSLRVSGDIYTRHAAATGAPPDPPSPGYPSFPMAQYSWYFRSSGATYADGTLTVAIVRHLWNPATQEFLSTDPGTLTLSFLVAAQELRGTLRIGGTTSAARAVKTSELYRGCHLEVDAMVNRRFPVSATIGSGAVATLRSVYASAGWDVTVTTDEIDVPDDPSLTVAELQTLIAAHRQSFPDEVWRLWLLVGSAQGTTFGLMFDDDSAPRQGAVGFADARFDDRPLIAAAARKQPLHAVPSAFLRTLIHEAGHAFNLFHPKNDVHAPGLGTEIMNQTGDVMGFATEANPYPDNAAFVFSEHDRQSLIHSPDPQVRPGWKNFGWGHGSLSAGLPVPVDVAGLAARDADEGLSLAVVLPAQAFVGEYVTAEVRLTNTGDQPRDVTGLLTLAEGDLVFIRTSPQGHLDHVLDIALGCGPRPLVRLEPGDSVANHVQVFFTNQGVTFEHPGRHTVVAQLHTDPVTTVYSAPVTIDIRTPASATELDISGKTLSGGVGRAFALGDFATDDTARAVLTDLAESHSDTDTGAASALVMANSLGRSFTDFASRLSRDADSSESERFLNLAVRGRSARRAVELAVTVASPTEKDAPVVADTLGVLRRDANDRGESGAGLAAAVRVAEDFVEARAR